MEKLLPMTAFAVFLATIGLAADQPRPLVDAIAEFNARAMKDETGKVQPSLTAAEVTAAIRGWIREQTPVDDATYHVFQTIADTGALPAGASLHFTTRWIGYHGYDFDVWWIGLDRDEGRESGLHVSHSRPENCLTARRPLNPTPASPASYLTALDERCSR